MKGRSIGGAFALLLLVLPSTGAQSEPSLVSLAWTDPSGDLKINTTAGVQSVPIAPEHLDLVKLEVHERNNTHLEFVIGVKRLEAYIADQSTSHPERVVEVFFSFGEVEYKLQAPGNSCSPVRFGALAAHMLVRTPAGSWAGGGCTRPKIDAAANTLTYVMSKEPIMDSDRVGIRQESVLESWYAISRARSMMPSSSNMQFPQIDVFDRAPDSGFAGRLISAAETELGSGPLALKALVSARASNGESTSLVFPVRVVNHAAHEQIVNLAVTSDEPTLKHRVPARVRLPANGHVDVPVIVTMEFTHDHGRTAVSTVRAEAEGNPGVFATTRLYIHWLQIPQPAGHHDKLWLHSGPGFDGATIDPMANVEPRRRAWMMALETDPTPGVTDDEVRPPYGSAAYTSLSSRTAQWEVPLSPRLAVGLDFDRSRQMLLRGQVRTGFATTTNSFEASLFYCDPSMPNAPPCWGGGAVLLGTGKVPGRSASTGAILDFEIPMSVEPAADLIPFQENSNLILQITFTADTPQTPYPPGPRAALVVKQTQLELPLMEYHDPIDQTFQSVGALKLDYQGAYERRVHPSGTVGYAFGLTNTGDQKHNVRLMVEGTNSDWARIDSAKANLGPGASHQGVLRVTAPHEAVPGEHAELFLIAESTTNANVVALIRLRVTVVSIDEAITESGDLGPEFEASGGKSPSPGAAPLIAAVAAVMLLQCLRRRRS